MTKTSKTITKKETKSKKRTVSETLVETQDAEESGKRKIVYVMRHGKASKEYETYTDKERPLAKRGKKDVKMMRKCLKRMKARPTLCLVSPSARTKETFDILKDAFPDATARYEDLLYDDRATRADLLDLLRQTPKDVDEVLVVGHLIPPLAALAASLADASVSDDDSLKDMGKKFPTAAVAVLELPENTDFADLADGSCRLTRFIRPKDLK